MGAADATKTPLLERLGLRYMERPADAAVVADDAVHVLNARERAALLRIERGAVARAAAAGALSAAACAAPAVALHAMRAAQPARYWALYVGACAVASVAEMVFLFWDGLRSVRALARTAGLDLGAEAMTRGRAVASALARAALEIPNPPDAVEGVNPWREASRFTLTVAPLLYKLKITLTNFVVKFLVRRALGRAATRVLLELLAVPINAVWDALVCWLIIHEARLRVMGPTAAHELVGLVFPPEVAVTPAAASLALRAVASAVVRSQDLHPNLVALLERVRERVGPCDAADLDDPRRFLAALAAADGATQTAALRTLAVASIIDGRLARAERRLLAEAFAACGRAAPVAAIEALLKAFTSGEPIARDAVDAVA